MTITALEIIRIRSTLHRDMVAAVPQVLDVPVLPSAGAGFGTALHPQVRRRPDVAARRSDRGAD